MTEKHLITVGDTVSHKGTLELETLHKLVFNFFKELEYDIRVAGNTMDNTANKNSESLKFVAWKKISDYIKFEVSVTMSANYENVEKRIKDRPKILQEGDFKVSVNAFVLTDYEKSWEQKAEYLFLRTLFNKFIYTVKNTNWDGVLKNHIGHLRTEVSSFFKNAHYAAQDL